MSIPAQKRALHITSFICVIILHKIPIVGRYRSKMTTAKHKVLTYRFVFLAYKYYKQTINPNTQLKRHKGLKLFQ